MIAKFDPKRYKKEVEKEHLELLAYIFMEDTTPVEGEISGYAKVASWKGKIFLSKFVNN